MKQGEEQHEKLDVTFRDGNRNLCVIRKDPEETEKAPEAPSELEQRGGGWFPYWHYKQTNNLTLI